MIPIYFIAILIDSSKIYFITLRYILEVKIMDKEFIGKKIKEYRKINNFTQETLGEKAGFHYSYIGQVERGEKEPSLKALNKIADALGVGVDKLLIDYDLSSEASIKISNITDLLLNRNEKELEMIYTLLKDLTQIFEHHNIEK